jgi:hypothetical protein
MRSRSFSSIHLSSPKEAGKYAIRDFDLVLFVRNDCLELLADKQPQKRLNPIYLDPALLVIDAGERHKVTLSAEFSHLER